MTPACPAHCLITPVSQPSQPHSSPHPPPLPPTPQEQLYQAAKARAKALLASLGVPFPRPHRSQLLNVLGVPKLPYVSHITLACQPLTLRLPFSVVPFWQAVQVSWHDSCCVPWQACCAGP
jgi:hypothetical protein